MEIYQHKQFPRWPLIALAFFALLRKKKRQGFPLALGLALAAMQLSALTTRVDERGVSWNFGLSLPIFEIPFSNIADVQLTQTGLLEGIGINWRPQHGWLWKVAGPDAVTIRKKNGSIVTLGTDDATGLYAAINTRMPRVN